MRALAVALAVMATVIPARAESPLVTELRAFSTRYHENLPHIDELRAALEKAAQSDPRPEIFLALSEACFMYGDVRARTPEEKLEAYDRGRQAAQRAIELAPKSAAARFWYGTNAGRWGQTKGVLRSLFLLPAVKEAMQTALELDPSFAPAYALGGTIYYEVPGFAGGDLDRSEALFRKGLEIDPHYTNMRLGLARPFAVSSPGASRSGPRTSPRGRRRPACLPSPTRQRRCGGCPPSGSSAPSSPWASTAPRRASSSASAGISWSGSGDWCRTTSIGSSPSRAWAERPPISWSPRASTSPASAWTSTCTASRPGWATCRRRTQ